MADLGCYRPCRRVSKENQEEMGKHADRSGEQNARKKGCSLLKQPARDQTSEVQGVSALGMALEKPSWDSST